MESGKKTDPKEHHKTDKLLIVASVILISVIGAVMLLAEQAEISHLPDEPVKNVSLSGADNPVSAAEENAFVSESPKETEQININTASKKELMKLDGIGEIRAESIISYREKTPFQKPQDIMKVNGIGVKTYEKNKDRICTN